MSGISVDDVAKLAALARIDMSESELATMTGELGAILGAVDKVQQIAGDDIPATSHPIPLVNVTRVDETIPGLTTDEALSGAPQAEDGRFAVPRILDEE